MRFVYFWRGSSRPCKYLGDEGLMKSVKASEKECTREQISQL